MSCFICDEKVANDKVHLATGIAPHSKLGLPAKISNLIGDDFVVVVTQSDNVCRRCSALINHMDKLETELTYVKKAITGYIRTKYNLPFDEESKSAVVNGDISPAKKPRKTPPAPIISKPTAIAPLVAQASSPASKNTSIAAATTPHEDPPKLKIYKCGFCSFQSKELNSVRLHMRVHIKPKSTPEEIKKVATPASAPTTPQAQNNTVRKKLFRCQVCSASFVDRKSCLQHIKLTHSKAASSNKENEQAATEQQTLPAPSQDEPMDTQPTENNDSQEASTTAADQIDQQSQEWETQAAPDSKMETDSQEEGAEGEAEDAHQQEEEEGQEATGEETHDDTTVSAEESQDKTTLGAEPLEQEHTETEEAPPGEEPKPAGEAEHKEDLDIEAMIAALHSDTATTTPENIAEL